MAFPFLQRLCALSGCRFPGLFVIHDEGAGNIWFTFTRMASEHFAKEAALRESMEALAILKVVCPFYTSNSGFVIVGLRPFISIRSL